MNRTRFMNALVKTFAFFAFVHVCIIIGEAVSAKQFNRINLFTLAGIDTYIPILGSGVNATILSLLFGILIFTLTFFCSKKK